MVIPNKRRATPRGVPNYPPSLRVASKCGACGVALLAKGTTLGFVPQGDFLRGVARLAVIRIWRQRVSCDECQQALVALDVPVRAGKMGVRFCHLPTGLDSCLNPDWRYST